MTIFEMAKKYYPHQWNAAMLRHLVELGRLTEDEYRKIVRG